MIGFKLPLFVLINCSWPKKRNSALSPAVTHSHPSLHLLTRINHIFKISSDSLLIAVNQCHHGQPRLLTTQLCCCYGISKHGCRCCSTPLGTYIGGLHSPPVSQPTAIHQDIQLVGEEDGGGGRGVRGEVWVGGEEEVVSGQALTGDPHGTGAARVLRLLSGGKKKNSEVRSL